MLLVNSIRGRDFAPSTFCHSDWRVGPLTASFADLVAPWFLLAVGLSLPYSMHSGRGAGVPFSRRLWTAAKRSALLFLIAGVIEATRVAYEHPITLRTLISVDVLAQIAVAYFIAVALYHGPRWTRPTFIVIVFLSKWILLAHWPYPGVGHPMWTPDQNMQDYLREHFPMFKGFHGALVAACIVAIGTYIGDLFRRGRPAARDALTLVAAGAAMLVIARLWAFDLPFNRYYHTPTWALLAAGSGSVILGVIHWACLRPWGRWIRVFEPWGRNAITVYVLAELLWPMVLLSWQVRVDGQSVSLWQGLEARLREVTGAAAAPWLQVGLYLLAFWLFAGLMYRKRIFPRL